MLRASTIGAPRAPIVKPLPHHAKKQVREVQRDIWENDQDQPAYQRHEHVRKITDQSIIPIMTSRRTPCISETAVQHPFFRSADAGKLWSDEDWRKDATDGESDPINRQRNGYMSSAVAWGV